MWLLTPKCCDNVNSETLQGHLPNSKAPSTCQCHDAVLFLSTKNRGVAEAKATYHYWGNGVSVWLTPRQWKTIYSETPCISIIQSTASPQFWTCYNGTNPGTLWCYQHQKTWGRWVWHQMSPLSPRNRSAAITSMLWRRKQWDIALSSAATRCASVDHEPYHGCCCCPATTIHIPCIEGIVTELNFHYNKFLCAYSYYFHLALLATLRPHVVTFLSAAFLHRCFEIPLFHHRFTLLPSPWYPDYLSLFSHRCILTPIFTQCPCHLNSCLLRRSLASWQTNDLGIMSSLRPRLGIPSASA